MIQIPPEIQTDFEVLLKEKGSEEKYRIHYRKWLRYYLDFSHKYGHCAADWESLPLFAEKLRQKQQTDMQVRQASHAVALYYESAEKEQRKPGQEERNAAEPEHSKISGNSAKTAGD